MMCVFFDIYATKTRSYTTERYLCVGLYCTYAAHKKKSPSRRRKPNFSISFQRCRKVTFCLFASHVRRNTLPNGWNALTKRVDRRLQTISQAFTRHCDRWLQSLSQLSSAQPMKLFTIANVGCEKKIWITSVFPTRVLAAGLLYCIAVSWRYVTADGQRTMSSANRTTRVVTQTATEW